MRQVFTLENPPPKNLKGQDLSDSYFGGTPEQLLNMRNINLTGCDLTNVTFVCCDAARAKMSGCTTYGIWSYRCDWTDATLPEDTGFLHRAWIVEILKQGMKQLSPDDPMRDVVQGEIDLLAIENLTEWAEAWRYGIERVSVEDMGRVHTWLFARYPRLARRFGRLMERHNA